MAESLGTELPKQIERCRELLKVYESIGAAGGFGKAVILNALKKAEEAQASGDVIEMIRAYNELKELE